MNEKPYVWNDGGWCENTNDDGSTEFVSILLNHQNGRSSAMFFARDNKLFVDGLDYLSKFDLLILTETIVNTLSQNPFFLPESTRLKSAVAEQFKSTALTASIPMKGGINTPPTTLPPSDSPKAQNGGE